MKRLNIYLEEAFYQLTQKDRDNLIVITGDEGDGKSNLGLNILDFWNNRLYGKTTPEDIRNISLDIKQFVKALKDLKQFELLVYDEAGELSNLRVMDRFNFAITQSYQVIRGLNLFTILVLPSIFYLNPFFSTRRARALIHVYKRGEFAYWGKDKLRKIIEINKDKKIKNVFRVKPDFFDHFPIYAGPLAEPYKLKKKEKIDRIREELYNKLGVDKAIIDKTPEYIYNAFSIVGVTKASKIFNCSTTNIYKWVKEYKKTIKTDVLEGRTTEEEVNKGYIISGVENEN